MSDKSGYVVWRRTGLRWEPLHTVGSQGGAEREVSMAVETAFRSEHRDRSAWMILPIGSEPDPGEQGSSRANR